MRFYYTIQTYVLSLCNIIHFPIYCVYMEAYKRYKSWHMSFSVRAFWMQTKMSIVFLWIIFSQRPQSQICTEFEFWSTTGTSSNVPGAGDSGVFKRIDITTKRRPMFRKEEETVGKLSKSNSFASDGGGELWKKFRLHFYPHISRAHASAWVLTFTRHNLVSTSLNSQRIDNKVMRQ